MDAKETPRAILVADDDPFSSRLLQSLLEKWGHSVALATDGGEALARLQSGDGPRLAVLDWMMPTLSGPDVCRALRENPPSQPVYLILLTFRGATEDIAAGLDSGADDYLVKPCEPTELRARVRAGLRMLELQEALLDRIDQMNRFLGIAAHDLRNPLGCIKIYSTLLLDPNLGGGLEPKQEKFVTAIRNSSNFMLRMVETFLGTSAIYDGQLVLQRKAEDLAALVAANLEVNRMLAEQKDMVVALTVPSGPVPVSLDRDKFDQVMNNLVSNAIKYSARGSKVTVTVEHQNGDAVVRVADEGCGIAPEDISKLFKPYSTLVAHGTGGEPSTGLGLFIAHRIVVGHGGRIQVDSSVGSGTTFSVSLPLDGA